MIETPTLIPNYHPSFTKEEFKRKMFNLFVPICNLPMIPFRIARWYMGRHVLKNPASHYGLHEAYKANVAMLLHDHYGITDYGTRNSAAEDTLELIFGDFYHRKKKNKDNYE